MESSWKPLSANQWDLDKARHLASRLGFSVHPACVERIHKLGPREVVALSLSKPKPMPPPSEIVSMREDFAAMAGSYRDRTREERQLMQKRNRESHTDFATAWYTFARDFDHSFQEKMVLFFQNVWVVSFQGVNQTIALFDYQDKMRRHLGGNYPDMCLALAQTAAMTRYLNLNQNRSGAPNENFARELFELFTLGEGNYTETDIKEAARACTGYGLDREGNVSFRPRLHDDGKKTVFGKTGKFDMADIIRLVFKQPAAGRFLPSELCQSYLSQDPLPEPVLEELANSWRKSQYNLPFLYETVFVSERFYQPEYRANLIKSPAHYYLGLLQDLELDVTPLPRAGFRLNRQMGQAFFTPPNVRGWVGGKMWINSATLAARRQTVQSLLYPLNEEKLNADEKRAMEAARAAGSNDFTVDPEKVRAWFAGPTPPAEVLADRLYVDQDASLLQTIIKPTAKAALRKDGNLRNALLTALYAPSYHLC